MAPLITLMNCYNEAEYIEYALKSVYNYVDRIVVIEGAFYETFLTNGGQQRSNDGTVEILNDFPDPDDKITTVFVDAGLTQLSQRNIGLQILKNTDCWMLIHDADEVYKAYDILRLKEILNETQSEGIKINSYTFVNDFKHYVPIAFPRAFRLREDCEYQFLYPNDLLKNGVRIPVKSYEDEVTFYHFSYTKSKERFMQKRKERIKLHGDFTWDIDERGIYKITSGSRGIKFTGTLPEIMKEHPSYYD